jgi:muramoyltetrapeptide carboxypeptidase
MVAGRLARGPEAYDETSFTRLVRGDAAGLRLSSPQVAVLHKGDAAGPLYGGTLTQLITSLGTPWPFDPPLGCVLFLEDVNERPFRIDRMLTQLRQSGILSRASALVFGEMRGCDEPGGTVTARAAIDAALADVHVPILFGFPAGHTTGPNVSLPLGVRVRVNADTDPSITIEESPVS